MKMDSPYFFYNREQNKDSQPEKTMWYWMNEYYWRLIAMMQQEADKHTIRKPTIKKQKPPKQSFKAQMRSVNRNR